MPQQPNFNGSRGTDLANVKHLISLLTLSMGSWPPNTCMIGKEGEREKNMEEEKETAHIKNAIIVKISFPAQGLPVIIMAAMTALLICLVAKVLGIFFFLN